MSKKNQLNLISFSYYCVIKLNYMDSKTNSQIIIENIKHEIKIQNLKLDFIAKSLGISIGEFSKILSGERKNFY